jgi:hypothetical protein
VCAVRSLTRTLGVFAFGKVAQARIALPCLAGGDGEDRGAPSLMRISMPRSRWGIRRHLRCVFRCPVAHPLARSLPATRNSQFGRGLQHSAGVRRWSGDGDVSVYGTVRDGHAWRAAATTRS